jgi:DNA-binding SARP family transcriptional activator/tetratricopeptide (TPR) repeat protein
VEFRILGPLQVYAEDGQPCAFEPRSARVLAVLLLSPDQVVSREYLVDAVWDDDPPATAKRQLQNCVTTLRRQLAGRGRPESLITADPPGYRIRVDQGQLDAQRFHELVDQAQAMSLHGQTDAVRHLRSALALWRGPALTGMTGRVIQAAATRLDEQRLAALEACLDLELQLGRHHQLIGKLAELAASHPVRERLVGQLMLALHRSGRQADALRAYHGLRERLADELGLDPGVQIQQLHTAILRNDPATLRTTPVTHTSVTAAVVPRQLPAPPQMFVGRTSELAIFGRVSNATTVVITAIDGMAGIGKTALAVHAAHQLADHYPDGQLFIDLHGYTQGITPLEPGDALDRLLRTLGVAGERIPADLDERAGLYRSRMADQEMLVVLDNAATETQIAPLLPGSPGCLVLVTSRRRLAGLNKTHTVSLDTLPLPEAVTLLIRTIGEQRLTDQPPEMLAETAELCGRLPLAIRIAAALLGSHSAWSLADLAQRLRDQDRRLVELDDGSRSVAAALELSYQQLPANQQHMYRLLGLHPGPDIDLYAAAALAGTTIDRAGWLLDQLLYAHLLQEPAPGRYTFHDLVRAHATSTAARAEPEPAGRPALSRLLDHYRHTASVAMDIAYPYERERRPRVPPAGTPTPHLPDPTGATAWLDTELPNLLAAARHAADNGRPEHTMNLSAILHRHLRTRGRYRDAETLHHQALTTAGAATDRAGEMEALFGLGHIHRRQGRYEQAANHFGQMLEIARATGHRASELDALLGLGHLHVRQGRHEQATNHLGLALQIARATGNRAGELATLNGLGHIHRRQGRHEQAIDHYEQALQIARATGDRAGELNALNGLGYIHQARGRHDQAIDHFGQALQIARATGHRAGELDVLNGLGYIHQARGRHDQAADHYQRILDIAQEIGDRNWQFEALQGLGRLHHATGHPDTAMAHHRQALELATDLAQPADQARAHDGLAHAHHALNQHRQARQHWQHALDILTNLGTDHTEEDQTSAPIIRAHLAGGK